MDEPRPGAPRKITDEQFEDVVVRTLETKPENVTHWSTRSVAAATGMTQNAIHRIWNAFGLQPHRTETFKQSKAPQFVDKVCHVIGLYLHPPDRAIVRCIDEKSQVQALDRSQPPLLMSCSSPERHTHDDFRHGTTSLFSALDVATGKVIGRCYRRHRSREFRRFMHGGRQHDTGRRRRCHPCRDRQLRDPQNGIRETLVCLSPALPRALRPNWRQLVERFFADITTKRIRCGFRSVKALETAIKKHLDAHNDVAKPFHWTATADLIPEHVHRVCQRTSQSGR